ncbi:hypothetical protein ACWEKT_02645 [Nocardia takedensis]
MIDPSRTVAIICGASEWPRLDYQDAVAFANTAAQLHGYFAGDGLRLGKENVLWLFDSNLTAVAQIDHINAFILSHLARTGSDGGRGELIIFSYVGHGAFLGADAAYSLLLRDTHEPSLSQTSIRVSDLAATLRSAAPKSSRIIILDSCFAGSAFKDFQGGLQQMTSVKIDEALEQGNSARGVALLCASSAKNPARLDSLHTTTLFGKALMTSLQFGDSLDPGPLSLRRICELTQEHLDKLPDAPRPEVHSPDQYGGDLASDRLFPNPAKQHPENTDYLTDFVHTFSPSRLRSEIERGPQTRKRGIALISWFIIPVVIVAITLKFREDANVAGFSSFGGGKPIIIDVRTWVIDGYGWKYTVSSVKRTISEYQFEQRPSLTIVATIERTEEAQFSKLELSVTDQNTNLLEAIPFAGFGNLDPPLHKVSDLETVVFDLDPGATNVTVTLRDFFWPDGQSLIIRGIPVS